MMLCKIGALYFCSVENILAGPWLDRTLESRDPNNRLSFWLDMILLIFSLDLSLLVFLTYFYSSVSLSCMFNRKSVEDYIIAKEKARLLIWTASGKKLSKIDIFVRICG